VREVMTMKKLTLRKALGTYVVTVDDETLAHHSVLMERDGEPVAVILPIAEYEALQSRYKRLQEEFEARLNELEQRQAYVEARLAALEEKLRQLLGESEYFAVRKVAVAG